MLLDRAPVSLDGSDITEAMPVCVDMDGTLLLTDSLYESFLSTVLSDYSVMLRLPGWLRLGKARLKRELAQRWEFDPAYLPYNQELLAYLRQQRAAGRRIVLCTAAHRLVAERIAAHLDIFDEVIATEGDDNLRGPAKADALTRRFGRGGFIYAGNDETDEAVWDQAAAAIIVNADAALQRRVAAKHRVAATFERRRDLAKAALRAARPYQWVKNLLCLVPLIAAVDFYDVSAWLHTLALLAGFCLVASSIYIVNDMSDLAADRKHHRKRNRPIASGALPLHQAMILAPILLVAGATLAAASGAIVFVAIYAVASVAYSMRLKEQPLVDVFMLAFLYTIRLFGGGIASGHEVSLWLLGFSSFLFLSLALVKRVSELGRHVGSAPGLLLARRGYGVEDLPTLQMFGCASTFASAIVLSLYVQSDVASRAYGNPEILWGAIPLLLFWQCRLWLSTSRGYMHDDPIVYAARDWVSWLVFGFLALVVLAAWAPIGS
jgi:4-hydroxybenzoate polyprenyltransferase/phosphoserine phosphatase